MLVVFLLGALLLAWWVLTIWAILWLLGFSVGGALTARRDRRAAAARERRVAEEAARGVTELETWLSEHTRS